MELISSQIVPKRLKGEHQSPSAVPFVHAVLKEQPTIFGIEMHKFSKSSCTIDSGMM